LMPRSLPYQARDDAPALEIGGDELPVSWLKEDHLRKLGTKDRPVVLLLGCSTSHAEAAFQNFAEAFKRKEAAVVLSTLSLILGRHAASFATALLEKLKEAAGQNLTFGDVLLRVKRQRVAAGDPFALSLVAYGDSETRICAR